MAELVNIGTLSAFVVICLAVIVLRHNDPDAARGFRTPFMPLTPIIGAAFSFWLLTRLPLIAWTRFILWMTLGLLVYYFYGRINSKLNQNS